jgi:hypothetical protein
MTLPIHETLRAAGQGLLGSAALVAPLCVGAAYFGLVGLVASAAAEGAALITAANALKRRDQRKAKDCS